MIGHHGFIPTKRLQHYKLNSVFDFAKEFWGWGLDYPFRQRCHIYLCNRSLPVEDHFLVDISNPVVIDSTSAFDFLRCEETSMWINF